MARSLSSRKRLRQNAKRAERNKGRKSVLKSQVRKVTDALTARDMNAATGALRSASALLDRDANRGTIHRNTAARRKSRLTKRVNALKSAAK